MTGDDGRLKASQVTGPGGAYVKVPNPILCFSNTNIKGS